MRTRLPATLTQHLAVVALNALHDGRAGSNLRLHKRLPKKGAKISLLIIRRNKVLC